MILKILVVVDLVTSVVTGSNYKCASVIQVTEFCFVGCVMRTRCCPCGLLDYMKFVYAQQLLFSTLYSVCADSFSHESCVCMNTIRITFREVRLCH